MSILCKMKTGLIGNVSKARTKTLSPRTLTPPHTNILRLMLLLDTSKPRVLDSSQANLTTSIIYLYSQHPFAYTH